ncbi:MAG: hypothetical protein HC810_02000 [Acaryochloridaceae cyanobacterium RL_2_7]|nr:hypothetical protein [Acaryochloridaceae cyanobacterium RL_2_7]
MNPLKKYRLSCTLAFGDIYGQVMVWLIVIFVSLAASVAMYQNPMYAFLTGGLILVLSLPFLLFAFVTTLLNNIEITPYEPVSQRLTAQTSDASPNMVQPS